MHGEEKGGDRVASDYFPSNTTHGRSTRAPAIGRRGMVASAHPYATQAGLDVLKDGGNAFDAAVAVASTLNVVEPYMSGVGGIGLALLYVAREKRSRVLNFSGRAPSRATPAEFTDQSKETGPRSPLVPGNVAGWLEMHGRYGRLPRQRLFRDATEYAQHGVPLTPFNAEMLKASWPLLTRFETTRKSFLGGASAPSQTGALFRQQGLAASMSAIAEGGASVFYEGAIARKIVRTMKQTDGLITEDDLGQYRPQWQEPLTADYRGFEVRTTPPNSSGFQILETLNVLGEFKKLEYGTPDTLHVLMEAVKLAAADRLKYSGDPDFVDVPVKRLLSETHAASLRKKVSMKESWRQPKQRYPREHLVAGDGLAEELPGAGRPEAGAAPRRQGPGAGQALPAPDFGPRAQGWWRDGLTTHFAVADLEGNVVTVTQTLGNAYGSGVIMGDTGIFLNNMCLWFDIDPRVPGPNLIGPGKRVDFCVAPCQLFRDAEFVLSIGTPGSYGILQTTTQMIHSFVDAGMNVQEAIEAPRFRLQEPGAETFEGRFPQELVDDLNSRGHTIRRIPEGWSRLVGGAHGLQRTPHGTYLGGADPRRDGVAMGF